MANYIPKIEYIELNTLVAKTILFPNPPEGDPFNERDKHSTTVTTSNNGERQYSYNYGRKYYEVEFIFQTEAIKLAVQDFFNNHAVKGGKFNYFIHSDEVDFQEFEIEGKEIDFGRPIPNEAGDFEYDFSLSMSRVL